MLKRLCDLGALLLIKDIIHLQRVLKPLIAKKYQIKLNQSILNYVGAHIEFLSCLPAYLQINSDIKYLIERPNYSKKDYINI